MWYPYMAGEVLQFLASKDDLFVGFNLDYCCTFKGNGRMSPKDDILKLAAIPKACVWILSITFCRRNDPTADADADAYIKRVGAQQNTDVFAFEPIHYGLMTCLMFQMHVKRSL